MPANLNELSEILYSGNLAYGYWARQFEAVIGKYNKRDRVVGTSSYNYAMLIALKALGLKIGDEVIASPMSCLASNQPLATLGIKVLWCDIDPNTGTIDPQYLRKLITTKTKAIIHNHHCGIPGYIDEVEYIKKQFGLLVIDDCIEAFASKYKGKYIAEFNSDAVVFSFQTVRLPNTIDGGAIIFNSEEHYNLALLLRDYGVNRSRFRDINGEISLKCDVEIDGFGAMPNEIMGYIGVKQMQELDSLLESQKNNGKKWTQFLESVFPEIQYLSNRDDIEPNFWVYNILTNEKMEMLSKFRSMGFYASSVHLNNNEYSVFHNNSNLIGVSDFYRRHLALPSGWWFNKSIEQVIHENLL